MCLQVIKAYGAHELQLHLFMMTVCFGGKWTGSIPGPCTSGGMATVRIILQDIWDTQLVYQYLEIIDCTDIRVTLPRISILYTSYYTN
jgi:hypothetical protein